MHDMSLVIRNMIRQALVLLAIIGLTFAAGVNWAEAATAHGAATGASPLPVVLIFLATIATLCRLLMQSHKAARVRARPGSRR